MSIEITFFILRALAGLTLAGFLLVLYILIWRNLKQMQLQLPSTRTIYGYLIGMTEIDGQFVQAGARFPLLPITTLGRSASNSIVVNDDFASGEHARIVLQDGHWWLEDRNSRNGTLLNAESIRHQTILADGDVIGIGSFHYRLELVKQGCSL